MDKAHTAGNLQLEMIFDLGLNNSDTCNQENIGVITPLPNEWAIQSLLLLKSYGTF